MVGQVGARPARLDIESALPDELGGLLDAIPQIALLLDPRGTVTRANTAWAEYTGSPLEAGSAFDAGDWLHPDDRSVLRIRWAASMRTGEPFVLAGRVRRRDGAHRWHLIRSLPVRGADERIERWLTTCSDVDQTRRAEHGLRLLAEATIRLDETLDLFETARAAASIAVPDLADWCFIDGLEPNGTVTRLAVVTAEEDRVELSGPLFAFPTNLGGASPAAVALRGGEPVLTDLSPALLDELARSPEHARILRELAPTSAMALPLVARGATLGVMLLVTTRSARRYDASDLDLAKELARRAAQAIANARLFRDVSRYKRVLDATLDAVFMFDPRSLRFSYANQGAVDQLGIERDALVGLDPVAISLDLDEERLRELIEPLVDGRLDSRTVTLTHRHHSGAGVPVEVLLQHVELPGEPGQIVAVARDISDRVEAQARLQRLAEAEHDRAAELNAVIRAMGDGVIVCDRSARITLANPAAEALFPRAPIRSYADVLARLVDPDDAAPRLLERGGPIELRISGDVERWIELSTFPVASRSAARDDDPGSGETIVLLRDVTDARQRQNVRDTFIGVLSHELRTPVTTIYAGSKVLARGLETLDPEVRRSVFEDIHLEAERLHRLVEDVIALTRFGDEGEGEIGNEPVLLQRVLPGVIASEQLRWPGVRFESRIPPGVATVVADPTYVEQVVRNLLSNAAKYSGPDSRVETIIEPGDGEVLVRILDDGPGFPDAEAGRLFDLYYRSPTTAGSASGAGIGLFVCSRLIRAMGGRIWAQRRPEGGAEFGFSLQVMGEE